MYEIKNCKNIEDEIIYDVFKEGFSDYLIKMSMSQDTFIDKFFGREGNVKEYSFIAYDEEKPVGLILAGLKKGEKFKTLRCGAMCVIPDSRNNGIGAMLLESYEKKAKILECKQLALEVITSNVEAVKLYEEHGFEKIYDLTYRKFQVGDFKVKYKSEYKKAQSKVSPITYDELYGLHGKEESHLPWQSEFHYFKEENCRFYGLFDFGELVAGLAINEEKIYYLFVMKDYRLKGFAIALLMNGIGRMEDVELGFSYSNNHLVHLFANHVGMTLEPIKQFELYKAI